MRGEVLGDIVAPTCGPFPCDEPVILQGRRSAGQRGAEWHTLGGNVPMATDHRFRASFSFPWHVAKHLATGPLSLRVVLRDRYGLATTRPTQSFVGPAPVYCAPPSSPGNVPAGDGWIVGGAYVEGGPFPGVYECESEAYTITATDSSGAVAASEDVAAGHSYTLVVPAGRYALRASSCGMASATVAAGAQTHADAVCPVP